MCYVYPPKLWEPQSNGTANEKYNCEARTRARTTVASLVGAGFDGVGIVAVVWSVTFCDKTTLTKAESRNNTKIFLNKITK